MKHLPELLAREDERTGVILCPPEWFAYDDDLRIDILNDWIYGLQRLRDATEIQMNTENAIRKAMRK